MTLQPDQLRFLRLMSDQLRSGDVERVHRAVTELLNSQDTEVMAAVLTGTYVDVHGLLWVSPDYAVMKARQAAADYGFWQLLSLAPDEACRKAGIDRSEIKTVRFRGYRETITHPDYYPSDHREYAPCRMTRFPDGVCSLPALKKIDASDTQFNVLPGNLGMCASLTEFRIAFFSGEELPESLGRISTLEMLQIVHSSIARWPAFIADMPALRFLKISDCAFGEMPADIMLPSSLNALHLDKINLKKIPDSVFECTGLQELSLVGNFITDIPYGFHRLLQLKQLNLLKNPVATKSELLKPVNHLINHNLVRKKGYGRNFEIGFRSSFLYDGFDVHSPSSRPEPYYSRPGRPPEDMAAAVNVISSMLNSREQSIFITGITLLEASGGSPEFTEHCLAAISPIPEGYIDPRLPRNACIHLLIDFLISYPDRSWCREGLWRYAFSDIQIAYDPARINGIGALFPNLRTIQLKLDGWSENVSTEHLSAAADAITFEAYKGSEMMFSGADFKPIKLIVQNSEISNTLRITGMRHVKSIRIMSVQVPEILISDCPDLEEVEYDWHNRTDFRVTRLTITDCPAMHSVSLNKICLSGLVLAGLPELKTIAMYGPGTNVSGYVIRDCPALETLTWNGGRLSAFPEFLTGISTLKNLALTKARLTSITADLSSMSSLRKLDLTGNQFTDVPPAVASLPALESLNMGYQKKNQPTKSLIQNLPDWLKTLGRLRILRILLPELKLRKMAVRFKQRRLTLTNNI